MATSKPKGKLQAQQQQGQQQGQESLDGISIDLGPELRAQVAKNENMLERSLTGKLVGYYVLLSLLVILTLTALSCLAFGHENPIWPMIITYVLGFMNNRGAVKAGKYARAIYESRRQALGPALNPGLGPALGPRRSSKEL